MSKTGAAPEDLRKGAQNLLLGCVGVASGDQVLMVREDPGPGYYDAAAGDAVEAEARRLGAQVHSLWTAAPLDGPETFPKVVAAAMEQVDHTIFFSRIGDQVRFASLPGRGTCTMTYALDAGYLASDFCTLPHALMQEVLRRFEAELNRAGDFRITCPLGTDVSGAMPPAAESGGEVTDFTLKLFPLAIFRPISCAAMSGRVALANWLMATGTHSYEPEILPLDKPVFAVIESGRIVGFEGDQDLCAKMSDHYARVADIFGIDPQVVHSWHVGIHPKTYYDGAARDNIDRWGNVMFASPRYLHFHTCGDYAPGEIAWSVIDTTVALDGTPYWQDGRFVFLDRPEIRTLLADYPGWEAAFEMRTDIGL
jgi:hypothetical protein